MRLSHFTLAVLPLLTACDATPEEPSAANTKILEVTNAEEEEATPEQPFLEAYKTQWYARIATVWDLVVETEGHELKPDQVTVEVTVDHYGRVQSLHFTQNGMEPEHLLRKFVIRALNHVKAESFSPELIKEVGHSLSDTLTFTIKPD